MRKTIKLARNSVAFQSKIDFFWWKKASIPNQRDILKFLRYEDLTFFGEKNNKNIRISV